MKRALTIAGSDPSGGGGLQADLRTFAAFGVHGLSAASAITAQGTAGVEGVWPVDPEFVRLQICTALSDPGADGAKTGMLCDEGVVLAVAEELRDAGLPWLVVDPVLAAKDGRELLTASGADALMRELAPLASLVTPNAPEAERLTGVEVKDERSMEAAARVILGRGAAAVLVKGGHLAGDPTDILVTALGTVRFQGARIHGTPARGTGCVLSAAILSGLVAGRSLAESIRIA
jgi:hydroxymethylpyrimidine/phosphomethylpyrimidine kinase